jgi:hypothetical protein
MAGARVEGPAVERGEEVLDIATGLRELDRPDDARRLFERVAPADERPDFLTRPVHELID